MVSDSLLILDTTREGDSTCPADFSRPLQAVIAKYLSRPLEEIEQIWLAVNLVETRVAYAPGQAYKTSLATIECELSKLEATLGQQGKTLQGVQTIILVDDEAIGCGSVAAGCAVQVFKRTHIDPMIIGVQETARETWHVVDAIPEPGEVDWRDPQTEVFLWGLDHTGNTFDRFALSIVAKVRQLKKTGQLSPVSPGFDTACAELERLCSDAQESLALLLATTQVLPIHAIVTRLVPQLPLEMNEQDLWDLEATARKAFARARIVARASENVACAVAQVACVNWVLQRQGGKDLLDLPDDLVQLIECVLDQVGHRSFRRKEMLPPTPLKSLFKEQD